MSSNEEVTCWRMAVERRLSERTFGGKRGDVNRLQAGTESGVSFAFLVNAEKRCNECVYSRHELRAPLDVLIHTLFLKQRRKRTKKLDMYSPICKVTILS